MLHELRWEGFHGQGSARVREADAVRPLTPSQVTRLQRAACGLAGCVCAGLHRVRWLSEARVYWDPQRCEWWFVPASRCHDDYWSRRR